MIIYYYTEINKAWDNDELEQKMAVMPADIKKKIRLKRNPHDAQLSVCGYVLMIATLIRFDLNLTLVELLYNEYQRPYFNAEFDFNVSHSGNMVVCCATINGKVGVDIELMGAVNFNYDDYFTANEQHYIRNDPNPDTAFFKYWTRKEALLKAVGTGFYTPLLAIDVSADSFVYEGETYYLSPVNIHPAYQSCVAHTVGQEISVQEIFV